MEECYRAYVVIAFDACSLIAFDPAIPRRRLHKRWSSIVGPLTFTRVTCKSSIYPKRSPARDTSPSNHHSNPRTPGSYSDDSAYVPTRKLHSNKMKSYNNSGKFSITPNSRRYFGKSSGISLLHSAMSPSTKPPLMSLPVLTLNRVYNADMTSGTCVLVCLSTFNHFFSYF